MKKLLNNILNKLIFLIDILAFQIKNYINQIKFKMIDQTLSKLLESLASISHEKITKVELLDGKLLFRYLGAKLFIIKSIDSNAPDFGYLTVYHETPLVEGNKRHVENFYLKVDKYGHVSITNYVKNQMSQLMQTLTNSGLITVLPDEAASAFVKHFEAKMLSERFELNPE